MTPADPGRLRHRVTIERAVGTPDGAGGETIVWEAVTTIWAAVEPVRAAEAAIAGHRAGVITHRVTFRRRDDLVAGMRLIHRGRVLRIRAIHDPDERLRFLCADCEEETT